MGLLLLLGFLGAVILAGVRTRAPGAGRRRPGGRRPSPRSAAGLAAAAVEWTWEIPGAFVPVIVVAGVLAGPALSHGRPALVPRGSRLLTAGVAVVGVACVVAGTIDLTSDSKFRASQEAPADGRPRDGGG